VKRVENKAKRPCYMMIVLNDSACIKESRLHLHEFFLYMPLFFSKILKLLYF